MLSRTFVQTTLRRGGPSLTTTNNNHALSSSTTISSRGFSSSSGSLELPRITERRPNETGRGGRASDAGVKVAVFGATGFLGRYVCSGLGEFIINYHHLDGLLYCMCGGLFEKLALKKFDILGREKFNYCNSIHGGGCVV